MSKLELGPDTVALLIPHRRPFVFLDRVCTFEREPLPTLTGQKQISANEPVFAGHFPGLSLWPGVHTIEGMGQAVNALIVLLAIVEAFERQGGTEATALEALRAIERRHRLGKRSPTDAERTILEALGEPRDRVGLAGAVDVKLEEPVFGGCTLDYRVTRTRVMHGALRCDVSASVAGRRVAVGTITSTAPLSG